MIWYMQYIVSGAQTWIISMYINLNIYDFSGVRTFKIGCKIALVGKPQSGWEGRAQQSEVTSPRSCNKIFKHLNRVYQDIESCWFPRCSNGGRSPTVSKYTGSPALQITPGPLMPIISKCPQSPFPAGLQMPPGPQVNPGFQVYPCPSDPPCLPVPALQVPPGPQLPLKASSNEQSEHTKFTKEFWDFASFPHISNIWIWRGGKTGLKEYQIQVWFKNQRASYSQEHPPRAYRNARKVNQNKWTSVHVPVNAPATGGSGSPGLLDVRSLPPCSSSSISPDLLHFWWSLGKFWVWCWLPKPRLQQPLVHFHKE